MKGNKLEKIKAKISKEESRLSALKLRKDEILRDIAKSEKMLENLKADIQLEEMKNLLEAARANNVLVSDIKAAIINKDFLSLQEKIEQEIEENIPVDGSTEEVTDYGDDLE